MAPNKNTIVEAAKLISAGEKYDVKFLVKVCIKMLEKKLHEENEIRDVFLGDLDDEENRKKAVLAIREIRDELYKNRSSRKIDTRRLFSREHDFPKPFSLTENQFSGKTYFYAIASRRRR